MKGLRKPTAQIARFAPEVEPAIPGNVLGLSDGMVPLELMRRIFPQRLLNDCAFAPLALSPTAAYSLPSGPKWDRATIMIRGVAQIVEIDQDELTVGRGDIPVRRKPADAIILPANQTRCNRGKRNGCLRNSDRTPRREDRARRSNRPDSVTNGLASNTPSLLMTRS